MKRTTAGLVIALLYVLSGCSLLQRQKGPQALENWYIGTYQLQQFLEPLDSTEQALVEKTKPALADVLNKTLAMQRLSVDSVVQTALASQDAFETLGKTPVNYRKFFGFSRAFVETSPLPLGRADSVSYIPFDNISKFGFSRKKIEEITDELVCRLIKNNYLTSGTVVLRVRLVTATEEKILATALLSFYSTSSGQPKDRVYISIISYEILETPPNGICVLF